MRGAECIEPRPRAAVFIVERQIDEVTGHRDMVGRETFQIAHDGFGDFRAMNEFALALPIDVAEAALADEIGEARPRRQVQIGQMREHDHRRMMRCESGTEQRLRAAGDGGGAYELPIRIPTPNTSTPPTTTWNAACRNGVSI